MRPAPASRGVSLVEILLATALAAIFVFPLASLLQVLQPSFIERKFGFTEKARSENTQVDPYDKALSVERFSSGEQSPIRIDPGAFADFRGKNSCRDFNPENAAMQYVLPSDIGWVPSLLPTHIDVLGDKLILAVNSSSSTDPDLLTFTIPEEGYASISDGSLDFGPGAIDMYVSGFTAYVANTSVLSQAKSIDLRNGLAVKSNFVIPGSNSTTSPIARKIISYKNLVIAGTEKSPLAEVAVFDAKTARYVGSVDTEYGINGLFAREDKLMVLGPSDPEVEVFDLAPLLSRHADAAPISLGKILEYDALGGSGNGRSADMIGNLLLFGRSRGGEELQLVDMPFFSRHPRLAGRPDEFPLVLAEKRTNASVDAVMFDAGYAFAYVFDEQEELQIFRIMRYGASGVYEFQKVNSFDLPGRVAGAVCRGTTMYVAVKDPEYPLIVITSVK